MSRLLLQAYIYLCLQMFWRFKVLELSRTGDVSAGGFCRSCRNLQRRLAQHLQNMRCFEAPDTITLQELGNDRLADAPCFAGRAREFPKVEQPGGGRAWLESNAKAARACGL